MRPDDQDLVRRVLEGRPDAFDGLLERYEKPIFNVALRMLGNKDDAEDVVQSVFLRAYRGLRKFDTERRFFSWLYRIAVNESLDAIRRRPAAGRLDEARSVAYDSPGDSPEAVEARIVVREALMTLTPDHRAVIVLRHHVGCSYAEMAQILELSEQTVKSRLFEARQQLKRRVLSRRTEGV